MSELSVSVRHGATVKRLRAADLPGAIGAVREAIRDVRREGPLEVVSALRTFEPTQRVAARIEISTGGRIRGSRAGIDVMGDSSLVAYAGRVGRRELCRGADLEEALTAVGAALG